MDKDAERLAKIQQAKQRISELKAQTQRNTPLAPDKEPKGKGLNVELHPFLTGKGEIPTINPRLQKVSNRGFSINPYLESIESTRPKRHLQFIEQGKYIKEGEELRKKQKVEELKQRLNEQQKLAGLLPNESLGEQFFKVEKSPSVEWWDQPFVHDNQLQLQNISIYLQHPIPIPAPWERHQPSVKAPHLTSKELKRKRRMEREERYKELQDKIKLGLEPPPPPKVKLSNLMSVLTSEAIKDPTAVEQRVRREVEERQRQHIQTNEERKLTKDQRHEKIESKKEKDLQKGYHSAIFMINKLQNPSHKFKLEINAKQLGLVGTITYGSSLALIVVEGSEKSIRFYKKLLMNRINWEQSTEVDGELLDLRGNKCHLMWEGQLREMHFKIFGVFRAVNDEGAVQYLSQFGVESYYREALNYLAS